MIRPRVGEIVRYVDDDGYVHAAIVSHVSTFGTVDLFVFHQTKGLIRRFGINVSTGPPNDPLARKCWLPLPISKDEAP